VNDGSSGARELPTGTVTFLFSDIEGSTRHLQSLGDRYPELLEAHHRLLREAITGEHGVVVGTEGDSFFAVFSAPWSAVAAAVRAQRALDAQPWPEGRRVRARMGIHTGLGKVAGGSYVGLDVHRAARITRAAYGGQVLLSAAAARGVEMAVPEAVSLRDLGEHRLRDFPEPERLHQLVIGGLPSDFPAVAGSEARKGNLPAQLTSFVGRERVLGELEDLVIRSRLVTLTGPGGTGKTTLALRCGADLLPRHQDGVFLVPLAPISDPDLVLPTLMQKLGIDDDSARSPIDLAVEHLASRDVLLILDNFEQVLTAADEVRELLERTDQPRVLATSREPLGLRGERQFPVPPMEIPDMGNLPGPEQLSRFEAVSLFVERAAAVRPGFALTEENARSIAAICARLDGLPLAIELAAARTKILSPQAILERLERRLPILEGESRDLPARQRTLRDTIAWSYDLLDGRQQTIFRRLSVFEGGFTLAAAEALDVEGLGDAFEGVASLVNKSLVRQVATELAEPRFVMLETIRDFAAEALAKAAEAEAIERRHADHFLAMAERAAPELTGSRQAAFLDALAADHDNLRRAIERSAARGWPEVALGLGAALWRFWQVRGHLREARERLNAIVQLPGAAEHPRALAGALSALGSVAYWIGDVRDAEAAYQRAITLVRGIGDQRALAEETYNLAFPVIVQDQAERATALLREAEVLFRELGDRRGEAKAQWAQSAADEEMDENARLAVATRALGVFRELGDRFHEGWVLRTIGNLNLQLGEFDEARARFSEGLLHFREVGDVSAMAIFVGTFADLAAAEGEAERAIRLAGAATAAREQSATGLAEWVGGSDERAALVARCATDDGARRLWAEGQAMTLDQAVDDALGRS
jgi:predicted ATPase/class 3 adenylate cyclase